MCVQPSNSKSGSHWHLLAFKDRADQWRIVCVKIYILLHKTLKTQILVNFTKPQKISPENTFRCQSLNPACSYIDLLWI